MAIQSGQRILNTVGKRLINPDTGKQQIHDPSAEKCCEVAEPCECAQGCINNGPNRVVVVCSNMSLCTGCVDTGSSTSQQVELLSGQLNGAFELFCTQPAIPGCQWLCTDTGATVRRYIYAFENDCSGEYNISVGQLQWRLLIGYYHYQKYLVCSTEGSGSIILWYLALGSNGNNYDCFQDRLGLTSYDCPHHPELGTWIWSKDATVSIYPG